VVDPAGFQTLGTTSRYKNFPTVPGAAPAADGMDIDQANVELDHDGKVSDVYPKGKYPIKEGVDNEDGVFLFGGSGIVKVLGVTFVSGDTTGSVWDIGFFDKDNLGNYLCETSHGTPCVVQVKILPKARTFDVLSSTCADVKVDTAIKY